MTRLGRAHIVAAFAGLFSLVVPGGAYAYLPLLAFGRWSVLPLLALPFQLLAVRAWGWADPRTAVACFVPLFWSAVADGDDDRRASPYLHHLLEVGAVPIGLAATCIVLWWPFVLSSDVPAPWTSDVSHLVFCGELGARLYDWPLWPPTVSCGYAPIVYAPFAAIGLLAALVVGKAASIASLWSLSRTAGRGRWSAVPFLCLPAIQAGAIDQPTLWLTAVLAFALRSGART